MMRTLLFFILIASSSLKAHSSVEETTSTFLNLPEWSIRGMVNPTSGQYFLSENDLNVRGAQPLSLPRHYISFDHYGQGGWSSLNHLFLRAHKIGSHYYYFSTYDKSGVPLFFGKEDASERKAPCHYLDLEQYGESLLKAPGQSNLRKAYALFENEACKLYFPDGSLRTYSKRMHKEKDVFREKGKVRTLYKYDYCLEEERLPNGNRILYEWSPQCELQSIVSCGPRPNTVYAVIEFKNDTATTSDGKTLQNHFHFHTQKFKGLQVTGKPYESFEYKGKRVSKRRFEEGPSFEISYHQPIIETYNFKHKEKKRTVREWGDKLVWPTAAVSRISDGSSSYDLTYLPNPEPGVSRLTTVIDPQGQKVEYRVDLKHQPKSITYYNDEKPFRTIDYQWQQGRLKKLSYREINKAHHFDYDLDGNLSREQLGDRITEYRYNSRHLLTWKKEPSGKTTKIAYWKETNLPARIEVEGLTTTHFTYNDDHILIEKREKDTLSEKVTRIKPHRSGEVSTKKAPLPALNLPEEISHYYLGGDKEILLKRERFYYDQNSRIASQEIFDANSHYTYDNEEHLIEEINPIGEHSYYAYDKQNNLVKETYPHKSLEIRRHFDSHSCLLSETQTDLETGESREQTFTYDRKKRLISQTDHLKNPTTYTYNADDLITRKTLPDGSQCTYTYDAAGSLTSETDGRGFTTKYTYNPHGQKTHILHPDQTEEHFTYNSDGTLSSHQNSSGTTTYTYDIYSRLTKETNALGEETHYQYDGPYLISKQSPNNHITYTYDKAGRLATETQNGRSKHYAYDTQNRRHKTKEGKRTYTATYDNLNRIRSETTHQKLTYAYDGHGNRKRITNSEKAQTLFTYNAFNELISKTDAEGHTVHIDRDQNTITTTYPNSSQKIDTLDPLGRPIKKEWRSRSGDLLHRESITYDANGNPTKIHAKETIAIAYDPMNRKIKQTESGLKTTQFAYTPTGLLNLIIKPDGSEIHKTYDTLGRLTNLTAPDIDYSYTYDVLGHLTHAYDHGNLIIQRDHNRHGEITRETILDTYTLSKTYDRHGRPLSLTYPDGKTATYAYDAYHPTQITFDTHTHHYLQRDRSGHILEEALIADLGTRTHTYNRLGREISRKDPHLTETYDQFDTQNNLHTHTLNNRTHHYHYDERNQLIYEPAHTYTYDALHNRTSKDHHHYPINQLNQIADFTYDANGNLTHDNQNSYTYDALDRLISVETPTETHHYTYDPLNRRLTANHNLFIYDRTQEIALISSNQITQRRVLDETATPIYCELSGQAYLPITTISGNIHTLIDLSNNPHTPISYTAFGEHTPTTLPWTYQSKRSDPTGLIYFGSRYYHPKLGRFLTPDPAGFHDSYNLYQYVFNNPFLYTDPDGEFIFMIPLIAAGGGSILAKALVATAVTAVTTYAIEKAIDKANNWHDTRSQTKTDYRYTGILAIPESQNYTDWLKYNKTSEDVYVPDRELPNTPDGVHVPDTDAPHTQLGTKEGRKGKYPQAREFDEYGNPVRDIDFTDHGRPRGHLDPHQHTHKPNPTGGTRIRDPKGQPVTGWKYL